MRAWRVDTVSTRKRTMKTLAIILFNCLLLSGTGTATAEAAPDFTLYNAKAEAVSLADYQGQPLVLHFWASWCPYCKRLQPRLQALQDEYSETGLVVLGISFREDEGVQPQAVLLSRGHTFMTLVEGDEVAPLYGVKGTPTTFFIDRQGNIVGRTSISDPDDPVWQAGVESIVDS
jgi:cytochrome c biogenesis protein CcmG/thiol:disulfide interchange protein DsbE